MKKIFLIFHGRFPSEKAASLFAAKSAEAFANHGIDVEVIVPGRKGVDENTAFDYYGVKRNFKVVKLPTVDLFNGPLQKIAFWMSFFVFSISCRKYLKLHAGPDDIVYSNESLPLYFAAKASPNTFYEMHDFPESKHWLFSRFLGRVRWMLVHNRWKIEKLDKTFSFPKENILYEPNAVDIGVFNKQISVQDARKSLGLPLDKKIAVYTGHLYGWKGVDTLARAGEMLGDEFLVVFVGGTEKDIAAFKARHASAKNLFIAGHKKHEEIPLWQKAADVLVLPNTAKEAISAYYTSPMKLFEYMASDRPIVASDIPSIREILDENNAVLVPADDPKSLAAAILFISRNEKYGRELATRALKDVENHTWAKRAGRIIKFIESHA